MERAQTMKEFQNSRLKRSTLLKSNKRPLLLWMMSKKDRKRQLREPKSRHQEMMMSQMTKKMLLNQRRKHKMILLDQSKPNQMKKDRNKILNQKVLLKLLKRSR